MQATKVKRDTRNIMDTKAKKERKVAVIITKSGDRKKDTNYDLNVATSKMRYE